MGSLGGSYRGEPELCNHCGEVTRPIIYTVVDHGDEFESGRKCPNCSEYAGSSFVSDTFWAIKFALIAVAVLFVVFVVRQIIR